MNFLINLIIFVVALCVLVVIHEFGHFITAKMFKVYVTEFSIGFGPALYSKKKENKETRFSIRGIPLGGYCAMVGESVPEFTEEEYNQLSDKDKELVDLYKTIPENRRLDGIKRWKRAIIMVAGVFLNYILGFVLVLVSNATADYQYITSNQLVISENSLASQAGLTSDDYINTASFYVYFAQSDKDATQKDTSEVFTLDCSIKEDDIENTNNLRYLLYNAASYTPQTVNDYIEYTFSIANKNDVVLVVKSIKNNNSYSWQSMGVTFKWTDYTRKLSFDEVMTYSFEDTGDFTVAIYKALGSLFTKEGISQVGGVITMFDISSTMTNMGFSYVLRFWGLISINLAVMNLLPFPGLDGWHLLVIIIESITRKELPKKFKTVMQTIGMILLFALMILITGKDIIFKIFNW